MREWKRSTCIVRASKKVQWCEWLLIFCTERLPLSFATHLPAHPNTHVHRHIAIDHAFIHGEVLVFKPATPRRAERHGDADARPTVQGVLVMSAAGRTSLDDIIDDG